MGIQHLNQFLKKNAASGIRIMSFKDLSGKKIAVEEKIRLKDYRDILLEVVSNTKTKAKGWICKDQKSD